MSTIAQRAKRGRGLTVATLLVLFLGLVTVMLMGAEIGASALVMGVVMALLPAPFYIALALWLDRFETEPARLLIFTFLWGAAGATFFSYVLNTVSGMIVTSSSGAEDGVVFSVVVAAPFFEEISKGIILFVLYYRKKDEFDGIIDGIVYAAMVGLGFAMVENFLYYGRAANAGDDIASGTFIIRGIFSPFAHPLFTAMTGIGLGWARQTNSTAVRALAPLGGLFGAMGLHFIWNASAFENDAFLAAYIVIMVPVFLGVILLIFFSLRREGRIIREHLERDLDSGLLCQEDYDCLHRATRRMGKSWSALTGNGYGAWKARREFHQIASELAFHRWRVERSGGENDEAAEVEAVYVRRLQELQEGSIQE